MGKHIVSDEVTTKQTNEFTHLCVDMNHSWEKKGKGFPTTCCRNSHHVSTLQSHWPPLALNRRWFFKSAFQHLANKERETKVRRRHQSSESPYLPSEYIRALRPLQRIDKVWELHFPQPLFDAMLSTHRRQLRTSWTHQGAQYRSLFRMAPGLSW